MSYAKWAALFGRTTLDPDVQQALKDAGVDEMPVIEADELSESVDFDGMTVEFVHPEILTADAQEVGDGVGYLTSVSMWLANEDELYVGPLPEGVKRGDTRAALIERYGEPDYVNDEDLFDEWKREDSTLRINYCGDYSSLEGVTLISPLEADAAP